MARYIPDGASGYITFGYSASFVQLGDLAVGFWVKFGSACSPGAGGGDIGGYGKFDVETQAENIVWDLKVEGSNNAWDITYVHEYGNGTNQLNRFDTNLPSNAWRYIGITRDSTNKKVHLYIGTGLTLSLFGTYTYSSQANGGNGLSNELMLLAGSPSSSPINPCDDTTIANFAYYGRQLAIGEHASLMWGFVPPGSLLLWAPILGYSPEPDWAGSGTSGTVNGTTVADGPPIRAPFSGLIAPPLTVPVATYTIDLAGSLSFAGALLVPDFLEDLVGTLSFSGGLQVTSGYWPYPHPPACVPVQRQSRVPPIELKREASERKGT